MSADLWASGHDVALGGIAGRRREAKPARKLWPANAPGKPSSAAYCLTTSATLWALSRSPLTRSPLRTRRKIGPAETLNRAQSTAALMGIHAEAATARAGSRAGRR